MMIPEITVQELANKLKSPDLFILLDVREDWEVEVASIVDSRLVIRPMSRLASEGIQALPEAARRRDAEILVLCHHGIRSADVAGGVCGLRSCKVVHCARARRPVST